MIFISISTVSFAIHTPTIKKAEEIEMDFDEIAGIIRFSIHLAALKDSKFCSKFIPEKPMDVFENGLRSGSFKRMKIPHKVKGDGTLILNIDPNWKDYGNE